MKARIFGCLLMIAFLNVISSPAGGISGTVTGPDGNTPLPEIFVEIYQWNSSSSFSYWEYIESSQTDHAGNYTINELPAGTYRVQFRDWNNGVYRPEVYDNAPDLNSGADIVVPGGTTVTGINASLEIASQISGQITGPDGVTPLPSIDATAHRWNQANSYWEHFEGGQTDHEGNYTIGGLPAGTYRVQFRDWHNGNYISEVYNNAPDLDSGTDIVVPAETNVTGIDASLETASKISGQVTGPGGITPLPDINVEAYQWNDTDSYWVYFESGYTDHEGNYTIGGLPAGTYRVRFQDWHNGDYVRETYDNAPDLHSGTDIVVPADTTVTGINASLETASKISGQVTGPGGVTPLPEIWVEAYRWNPEGEYWEQFESSYTHQTGNFTIGGLPAGTYRVRFRDWNNGFYTTEVYSNVLSLYSGTDIVLPADTTVTGIDASLGIASKISGQVTGPDGITPLPGIWAEIYQWDPSASAWEPLDFWADCDQNGNYTIGGLPAGTYRVQFEDWENELYATVVYLNAPNINSGTDIVVPAETTVTGINVSMTLAQPAWDAGFINLGGGWRRLEGFGDYVPMGADGWIWHNQHGFFYVAQNAEPASIWLYSQDMGWLWTSQTVYPFLYRQQDGAWLWYNGATNPRWFVNMTTGHWESRP